MADIANLLAKLPSWKPARDALRELAKLPPATKRAEVYPEVIELAVTWWCVEDGASDCGYEIENVVKFLTAELAAEPDLGKTVFDAIGKRAPKLRLHTLYEFVRATRDRRGLPLLRGLWKQHSSYWADTVVALCGSELADDLLAALIANPESSDSDFATAAGLLAGERAIKPLQKLFASKDGYCKDGFALGLALAGHDDEAFFKDLSTSGEGATAKRLWAAFHKPKQKDRLAAIDALLKDAAKSKNYVRPGLPLGCCRLLDDADPVIVERAAAVLAAYAKRGPYQHRGDVYHGYFLDRAAAAIARGVWPGVRRTLDTVRASIPRAAPFAKGGDAPPIPEMEKPSKAKQKGLDALAALKASLPAKAATHRDPGLEALIVEAPDDTARYLVYADWLQTKGDPRGMLIALHDAARRGDKTAESTAAALMIEHRHALYGLLDGAKEIQLDWQLGFIRGARLKYPNQKTLLAGLQALLAAESARFLQSIVIDPLEDKKTPDSKLIVDALIEHAPRTLAHVQVGKPGKWTLPDELRAAFPRLARDPTLVWDEVLAKIAEQKRLEVRYIDPKRLPKLEPLAGKPVADPEQILVGLRAEVEKAKPIGIIAALPRTFTQASLDAFTLSLVEQWTENDDQPTVKFAFDCAGALGGDACAKFLGKNLTVWSHQRAVQALEHLKRIGSDLALYQIVRLALVPGLQPRRDAAEATLEALAKARGRTFDELLDELHPPDTDVLVQRAWLTRLLVHGHRIAPATFRTIAAHPIRGRFAATLVWGTFAGQRDLLETFAVGRDGSLRTSDGQPFELGDSRVGLVHPVELSRELLDTWRETLQRRDLEQAILQLDRPTFRMSAADANTETLDWFAKRRAGFTLIQTTLAERDWIVYEQYDQGGTESFARRFERGNVTAVASFGTNMGAIGTVLVYGKNRYDRRRFDSLDPVTQSELLYDLEVAHGYREGRPARSSAPAPRGPEQPEPIVERAKTGRAKCVVCEQPIAKGDPRVGVDRQIKTDTFTGRGTVWAHPACKAGMPELAGIDVDARIAKL